MNSIARRIATGATLAVAPVLIALGAAGASQADATGFAHGPSFNAPTHHQTFPHQDMSINQPGSTAHHHHQWQCVSHVDFFLEAADLSVRPLDNAPLNTFWQPLMA